MPHRELSWSPRFVHGYHTLVEAMALHPRKIGGDPGYFDEVPLYSRLQQLVFLDGLPRDERWGAIFFMAARFWSEAEANLVALAYPRAYALFLSIWEWESDDAPNPYVFFCASDTERVRRGVELGEPSSAWSAHVRGFAAAAGLSDVIQIYEDRATVPGTVRVVVDFDLPTNPNKQTLRALAAPG